MSTAWDATGTPDDRRRPSLPPPPPRPWSVGEGVAWAAIILLAGLAAVLAVLEQKAAADTGENPNLTLASKIVMGAHQLTQQEMVGSLETAAKTPEDRVRLAIVAAEIQGKDAGLARLETLKQQNPSMAPDVESARALCAGDEVTPEIWQAFQKKYGWFADLARSAGAPADDPLRQQIMADCVRALLVYIGALVGGLGLAVVGLILLIVGIVQLASGRIRLAFRRTDPDAPPETAALANRGAYAEGMAWYLFGMIAFAIGLSLLLRAIHWPRQAAIGLEFVAMAAAFGLGLFWPRLRGQSGAQWREALGLHRGRGVLREIGCGILGYVAGVPVMVVGIILTIALSRLSDITPTHPINEVLTQGWLWIALAFVLASIWAPITEELMFRGALFAHLRERFGWWISAPVVGFIFAIIHPQGWVALPVLGSIGFVFCGIREWRGSIIGCITAHALHNTATLIVAVTLLK